MREIKRYRCIKGLYFDLYKTYPDDGSADDGDYMYVEPGSIWQVSSDMVAGGVNHIHLDREDGAPNTMEWCEPLRDILDDYFEPLESIFV